MATSNLVYERFMPHPDALQARVEAREAAHTAVKNFDHKPDSTNTTAAIAALRHYLGLLSCS